MFTIISISVLDTRVIPKYFLFLNLFYLTGCTSNQKVQDISLRGPQQIGVKMESDSVSENLKLRADHLMMSNGYKLEKLSKRVLEDSVNFYVVYEVSVPNYKGGGGRVTFRKSDLEIVEKKFEE